MHMQIDIEFEMLEHIFRPLSLPTCHSKSLNDLVHVNKTQLQLISVRKNRVYGQVGWVVFKICRSYLTFQPD